MTKRDHIRLYLLCTSETRDRNMDIDRIDQTFLGPDVLAEPPLLVEPHPTCDWFAVLHLSLIHI